VIAGKPADDAASAYGDGLAAEIRRALHVA